MLARRFSHKTHNLVLSARNFSTASPTKVIGESFNQALDLNASYVGQVIEVPYEHTVNQSHQTLWQSSFYNFDRIYSSSPFAQQLGLAQNILPFSFVMFKTISMGHVDSKVDVLDVSYDNAVYVRPAFADDTFKQVFTIKHIRQTRDHKNSLVTVGCELLNQKSQVVFSCDKTMLYPGITHPNKIITQSKQNPEEDHHHTKPSPLLAHILFHGESLHASQSNLANLRPSQLILHSVARPLGVSTNWSLSTLFRWTHPQIFNNHKTHQQQPASYSHEDDLLVPGGLALAAATSLTTRDLYECLHERLVSCSLLNKLHPLDMMGALSYIEKIKTLREGFEEVHVTTLGVKNCDVVNELSKVEIPTSIFSKTPSKPTKFEEMLKHECPSLAGKVAVHAKRVLVRQSPFSQHRNMPLL